MEQLKPGYYWIDTLGNGEWQIGEVYTEGNDNGIWIIGRDYPLEVDKVRFIAKFTDNGEREIVRFEPPDPGLVPGKPGQLYI